MNFITRYIGPEYAGLMKVRFAELDEHYVCAVDVDTAPEPVFMKKNSKGAEFFVRVGNTSRSLDAEEMHRYIQMNWG